MGVDTDVKQRMLHWSEYRRAQGYHGRWTSVLPFIDDNTVACISANGRWTAKVIEVIESVWHRYNYELSHDKSVTNEFDTDDWHPVLGRVMNTRDRTISLPAVKVERYCRDIDAIIDEAEAHPKRLVKKNACERIFGRLLFACDSGVPTIWPDFLNIITTGRRR